MFVRRSANLLRSALRFRGALKQSFATVKSRTAPSKFNKLLMFGVALIPTTTMLIYCAEDDVEIFETEANLSEGEFKTVQVGPKDEDLILLVKRDGKYYCVQNSCPHYGFQLSKGLMIGGLIVCPLHNATFDVKTGRVETGPIYDGLETYKVQEVGNKVKIHVPKSRVNKNKTPKMAKKLNDNNPMVIIGGGPASESALEGLRKAGHTGKIVLITKDEFIPYDRTGLSKRWDVTKTNLNIRSHEFYKEHGIDVMTNSPVKSIDYANKQVVLESGEKIDYEKLLIASGCENIPPNNIPKLPGLNMLQLRTIKDYENIKSSIEALNDRKIKNITIVGGGFIGWEIASTLQNAYKEKIKVTVIDNNAVPHQKIFGAEVAKVLLKIATNNGIHYERNTTIRGSEGNPEDDQVRNIILTNKNYVPTDLLILGIGVKPVTNFVGDLALDSKNQGIKTDVFLKTSQKDVYAAGDVASYPYWYTGQQARIEHYNEAIYQGEVAALNMLGKKFPMDNIPFFWSRAFNQSIQFVGYVSSYDQIHVKGDLEKPEFVAYYLKNNKVVGASCMNSLNSIMIVREAMRNGIMPSAQDVKKADFNLNALVEEIKKKKPVCKKCDIITNEL